MRPDPTEATHDEDAIVDETNHSNVLYWAERLMVNETTLRLLISLHGPRVPDLHLAIRKATIRRVKLDRPAT